MTTEIKVNDRLAKVELIEQIDNKFIITIDGKKFDADIVKVEDGIYSLISDGVSYNVMIVEGKNHKNFKVNTFYQTFDLDIVDAETRYRSSHNDSDMDDDNTVISSPMPGKVVQILVNVGDKVVQGTSVIVVEAMKMQNHYKVKKDRVVKEICVKEGDTVDANQPLIIVE